jgi:hypothetical protein
MNNKFAQLSVLGQLGSLAEMECPSDGGGGGR